MIIILLLIHLVFSALYFRSLQTNFQIQKHIIGDTFNGSGTFTNPINRPARFIDQQIKFFMTLYNFNFESNKDFYISNHTKPTNSNIYYSFTFHSDYTSNQITIAILVTNHYGIFSSDPYKIIGIDSNNSSPLNYSQFTDYPPGSSNVRINETKIAYGLWGIHGGKIQQNATDQFNNDSNTNVIGHWVFNFTIGHRMNGFVIYTQVLQINKTLDYHGIYRLTYNRQTYKHNSTKQSNFPVAFNFQPPFLPTKSGNLSSTQFSWFIQFALRNATNNNSIRVEYTKNQNNNQFYYSLNGSIQNYTFQTLIFMQLFCNDTNQIISQNQQKCVTSCLGPQKVIIQDKNLCFCVNGIFQQDCSCNNSYSGIDNVGCIECQRTCTFCDLKRNWDLSRGQCICLNGYFRNSNVCQECYVKCQTCNISATNCTTCPQTRSGVPSCNCIGTYVQNYPITKECRPCSQYCLTCLNTFDNCITCDSNKNRTLNINKCICRSGYFQQAGSSSCAKCFHLCNNCTSKEECYSCITNANFIGTTGTKCQCTKGFYDNGNQCGPCPNHCDGCLSANICIDCNSYANFKKQNESGKCVCISQYFLSSSTPTLICTKCNNICKECFNTSDNCTFCYPKFYLSFNNNKGQCKCQPTYYLNNTTTPVKCQQCALKCKTCNSTHCLSCFTQLRRQLSNNQCVCQQKYYEPASAVGDQCLKCNYKCLTCSTNAPKCDSCFGTNRTIPPDCNCTSTYYDNFQENCKKCVNRCQQCQSQYYCITCKPSSNSSIQTYKIKNGQCICFTNSSTFDQGTGCQKCHYSCQSCRNDINCISCNSSNFRKFVQGKCQCITGYYDNKSSACIPCNTTTYPFCVTCINESVCQTCDFIKNRTLTNDRKCQCFPGYYNQSSSEICTPCHYSCKTCTSDTQNSCTSCDGSNFRKKNQNTCQCVNHYFDENNTPRCKPCHYSCLTCNDQQKNNCTHCDTTADRFQPPANGQCLCEKQYYDDGESKECFSCHYACQTCTHINTCDSCTNDTNQNDDSLKVHRKFNPFTLNCQCILGYFDSELDQKICLKCHYSCKHCTKRVCLSCDQTKQRISIQTFECACKPGYFDDGINEECLQCDKVCKTCIERKDKCMECRNQKMKYNSSTNSCTCLDGYYTTQNNDCKICTIPFCRKCSKIDQCDQCQGNLYLQSQTECFKICNKNEYFDSKNKRCLPYCPLYYYFNEQSRKCEKDISSKLRQHGFIFEVKGEEVYESNSAKLLLNITFTLSPITFLKNVQEILSVYQKQTKLNYNYTAKNNYINLTLEPYQTQFNQPIYIVFDKINVIVNNTYFLQNQREELIVVNFVTPEDAYKRNIINIILLIMAIIVFLTLLLPMPFTSFQQFFYYGILIIYKSNGKLPYILPNFSPSFLHYFIDFNSNIELKILMLISVLLIIILNKFLRKLPNARLILLVQKSKALFSFYHVYSLPILYTFFNSLGAKNTKLQLYTFFIEAFLFSSALVFICFIIQNQLFQNPGVLSPFLQTNTGKQYAHSFSRIWRMLLISVSSVFEPKIALIISLVCHVIYGAFILLRNEGIVFEYISLVIIVVINGLLVIIQFYRMENESFIYSGYVIFIIFVLGYVFWLLVDGIRIINFLKKYKQSQNEKNNKNQIRQIQMQYLAINK